MINTTTQLTSSLPGIPVGLDEWLVEYLHKADSETQVLRENGAIGQAAARDALVRGLLHCATEYFEQEVTVSEAAGLLGQCEETVRRAIREGRLPDNRKQPRGHHRVKRRDVVSVARGNRKYNPVADAQDIAKLRRSA